MQKNTQSTQKHRELCVGFELLTVEHCMDAKTSFAWDALDGLIEQNSVQGQSLNMKRADMI